MTSFFKEFSLNIYAEMTLIHAHGKAVGIISNTYIFLLSLGECVLKSIVITASMKKYQRFASSKINSVTARR